MMAAKILVINLAHAEQRRRETQRILEHFQLPFEFLDAVDGNTLSEEEILSVYDRSNNARAFKRPLSRPEIGCYLSHYKAWQIIAATSEPGIILEDDFEPSGDFKHVLLSLLSLELPQALIKLEGGNRPSRWLGSLPGSSYGLVEPFVTPPFTTGYVLTPGMARVLVERALPFSRPVDIDLKHWWELGIRVLALRPDVVRPRNNASAGSTIMAARALMRGGSRSHRFHKNVRYQVSFLINLCRAKMQHPHIALKSDDAN